MLRRFFHYSIKPKPLFPQLFELDLLLVLIVSRFLGCVLITITYIPLLYDVLTHHKHDSLGGTAITDNDDNHMANS